jgi:hypothetical protein
MQALILLSCLLLSIVHVATAGEVSFNQSTTECYVSSGGCAWDIPSIWNNNMVPSLNDSVYITSNSSFRILILLGNSLPLASMTMKGNVTLSVEGATSLIIQTSLQVGKESKLDVSDTALVNCGEVNIDGVLSLRRSAVFVVGVMYVDTTGTLSAQDFAELTMYAQVEG